jgi:predicted  nucleic acid-binding Zn-ribbon protein
MQGTQHKEEEEMTDVTTIDHTAKLKAELTRLDREIRETRGQISCLQNELDDLEVERSELLDELGDDED